MRDTVGERTVASVVPPTTDRGTRPENYQRALLVFTLVVSFFVVMFKYPFDDGLRHVGVAFGEPRSWGEVYPHSVFSENPTYDPWWGYDLMLRGLAAAFRPLGLPRVVAQTIVVKVLAFGFLASFLLLALRRSGLPEKVRSRETLIAAAALITLMLSLPIARVTSVRPFVLGSLYLLFALTGGGALRGVAAAGVLGICYPYLFWVYTLPVAVAHLWRGDRRFGAGTFALTVAGIAVQPRGFWALLEGLARSEGIRSALTIKIDELKPSTTEPFLVGAVVLGLLCVVPFLPAASRRMGVPHIFMLCFAPAAAKYLRYLIDVEMVMLFVILSAGLADPLAARLRQIGEFWEERLRALGARLGRRSPAIPGSTGDGLNLRQLIAVTSLIFVVVLASVMSKHHRDDAGLAQLLLAVPKGSLVLTNFDMQYPLLFVRPDLRLVPSCELGFPTETILPAYMRYFDEGDLCGLARTIGAQWFVGPVSMPFDPGKSACLGRMVGLALVGEQLTIALWKVVPG